MFFLYVGTHAHAAVKKEIEHEKSTHSQKPNYREIFYEIVKYLATCSSASFHFVDVWKFNSFFFLPLVCLYVCVAVGIQFTIVWNFKTRTNVFWTRNCVRVSSRSLARSIVGWLVGVAGAR